MSIREGAAAAIAAVTVVVSAVAGVRAQTGLRELACQFVGVSTDESGRTYPTAIEAAAAFASNPLAVRSGLFRVNRGVIDVTGPDIVTDPSPKRTVFAVRDHSRTVALLSVDRDIGGWAVGRVEIC